MADVLPLGGKDNDRLAPGTRLGRYELLVPVARGGMARVWAARQHGQRGFTKIVAVKTILPHLRKEAQFERMFLNEARVASLVQHPNCCQILELGEDAEILFMAMEWINGDSLARALKSSGRVVPMDPRIIARVLADACAGIHSAHVQTDELGRPLNIVHRDISPHNIMFTADGNVKVCDFGVAKALNQLQDATLAGQVKGKVSYMPPEQFMGAPLDARADIFAMGVVLYEATTGRTPFEGENDLMIMQRLARGEYAHPSRVVPSYPRELEQIIVRAMQSEPMHRFQSAEQMRIALEEWLARSGPIVTQTNVAQAMRERVGGLMEARLRQIQYVSQGQDPNQAVAELAGHTPSNLQPNAPQNFGSPKSGVMPRGAPPPLPPSLPPPRPTRPPPGASLKATMPLPPGMMPPLTIPPTSSQPQAPVAPPAPQWWEQARDPLAPHSKPSIPVPNPNALPMPAHFAQVTAPGIEPNAPNTPVQPRSSGASYYAIAIVLGVIFAGVIGAAGYFAWMRSRVNSGDPVAIVSVKTSPANTSPTNPTPTVAVSSLPLVPNIVPTAAPSSAAPFDQVAPSASAAPIPTMRVGFDDPKPSNANATSTTQATTTAVPAWTASPSNPTSAPANGNPASQTAPAQTSQGSSSQASQNTSTTKPQTTSAAATASAAPVKPVKPSSLPDNPY